VCVYETPLKLIRYDLQVGRFFLFTLVRFWEAGSTQLGVPSQNATDGDYYGLRLGPGKNDRKYLRNIDHDTLAFNRWLNMPVVPLYAGNHHATGQPMCEAV
jgi:hypothetical protein